MITIFNIKTDKIHIAEVWRDEGVTKFLRNLGSALAYAKDDQAEAIIRAFPSYVDMYRCEIIAQKKKALALKKSHL